jgi:hypothetical protein
MNRINIRTVNGAMHNDGYLNSRYRQLQIEQHLETFSRELFYCYKHVNKLCRFTSVRTLLG